MSSELFKSKDDVENFIKTLVYYSNTKDEKHISEILLNSEYQFEWYTHDNWNGGFDLYDFILTAPIDLYVCIEDKLEEIAARILTTANRFLQTNDGINLYLEYILHPFNMKISSKIVFITNL